MLTKSITYTDYNDVERTEEFRFNLTKAELTEMELTTPGGLVKLIEKLVAEKELPQIMELWKKVILLSYGEKSPDGKRFIKSKELSEAFTQTEAYSILFMELSTNADAAVSFINGVMPKFD